MLRKRQNGYAKHRDHEYEHLKECDYHRLHELILPPTPDRIERLIRSAIYIYEESFIQATYLKLPSTFLAQLDSLIDRISYLEIDEDEAANDGGIQVSFNELKADPGRVGVDSVQGS